jgi:hypothetical protein
MYLIGQHSEGKKLCKGTVLKEFINSKANLKDFKIIHLVFLTITSSQEMSLSFGSLQESGRNSVTFCCPFIGGSQDFFF